MTPERMTDEELGTIAEAVARRAEAAGKSEAGKWPDRAAVVGRMTYSAERLLEEVRRLEEEVETLDREFERSFAIAQQFADKADWQENRISALEKALGVYANAENWWRTEFALYDGEAQHEGDVWHPIYDGAPERGVTVARKALAAEAPGEAPE